MRGRRQAAIHTVHCHSRAVASVGSTSVTATEQLSGGTAEFRGEEEMSTYAVQAGYFNSTENNENRGTAKPRGKDGEAREMKMPVQGTRTVLGSLTNKPLVNVAVKSKQVKAVL